MGESRPLCKELLIELKETFRINVLLGRVWGGIPGEIIEEKTRSGTYSGSGRKLTLEEDAGGEGPQLKMKSGT